MTREKILLRNAIKVVEIDGCIDAWNNIRPECTESDFPIEGILDVVKELVPKAKQIYAVKLCINGEMKFLGKKEGEDLSLYLFNAELIRTESWWEDKEGDRITEEPDEWPDEYDLEIEEEDDMVDFKEIEHLISADYPRYYCWESDDTAYHKKRKLYRIKEGNVI